MRRYYTLFLLILLSFFLSTEAVGQCITSFSVTNVKDVSCKGGNDGEVTVELVGGEEPFRFQLVIEESFSDILVGEVIGTTDRTVTFSLANGNVAGFGITAANNYKVRVISSDENLSPGCNSRQKSGIVIAEPAEALTANATSTTAACAPGTGAIDLDVSGGWGGYNFSWTGPTTVGDVEDPTGLDAGIYAVDVTDAKGCVFTLNNIEVLPGTEGGILSPTALEVCADDNSGSFNLSGHNGDIVRWESSTDNFSTDITAIGNAGNASYTFTDLAQTTYYRAVVQAPGCPIDYSDVAVVTVNKLTVADAGPDQAVLCVDNTTLAANAVGAGETGTWTVTQGSGLIADIHDPNTTVSGLTPGINEFTWTITDDSGLCPPNADAVVIPFTDLAATVSASDITCNGADDGSITVTPTGGLSDYEYSLDGTTFQSSNIFTGLAAGSYTITISDANGCTTTATAIINEPVALTAIASADDAKCNGAADGSITVTASGGTPGFEYSLDGTTFQSSNIFTGLAAGTYTITVRDANACTTTVSSTINEPAALIATATTSGTQCYNASNGSITVTASGGTAAYEYSLDGTTFQTSNVFTGLDADTYTITVRDANACTTTVSATVTEPPLLTATATTTDITCNGAGDGSITITASGGVPGYKYSLNGVSFQSSNVFSDFEAGIYTITIRDAKGCTTTVPAMIKEPDVLTATAAAADITCNGAADGSITVTPSGGTAAYEYSIDGGAFQSSNIFSDLDKGNYTITVRDVNGCLTSTSAQIEEPAVLTATAIATDAKCNGAADGSITLTAAGGTEVYEYSLDGTTFQFSDTFTGLSAGTYTVTVRDANACTTTVSATVNEPTALTATATVSNVQCNGTEDGSVSLIPSGGTPNYEYSIDGVAFQASNSFNGLDAGSYTFTVRDANGCAITVPATITEPDTVAVTATTLPDCDATGIGSIDLTVTGGTAVYSFAWTGPTAIGNVEDPTGLLAGTYSVEVTDANGCSFTLNGVEVLKGSEGGTLTPVALEVCAGDNTDTLNLAGYNGEIVRWESSTDNFATDIQDLGNAESTAFVFNDLTQTTYYRVAIQAPGCAIVYSDAAVVTVGEITAADAGTDQSVCVPKTTLAANAAGTGETGEWTVLDGTGIFTDINDANAVVSGLSEGINQFIWTISDDKGTCPSSADTVAITFIELTIADAGLDQTLCADSTTLAADTVKTGEIGTWTVLEGTGVFADQNDPSTVVDGLSVGTNRFVWTVQDQGGICTPTQDTVAVIVEDITVADAGTDQSVCSPKTTLAANAVGTGETGLWTVLSGSGVFANANDPNTDIINLAEGENIFVWTINSSGTCPATTDTVVISYIDLTAANAGTDQQICANNTVLSANAPKTTEKGVWTIFTGSGTFVDPNDPNTSVTGLGNGLNVFVWTISDTANVCTPSADEVQIEVIGNLTVADAGTDQAVCADNATLTGNAVASGEKGVWTSLNPAAVIANVNDPNTLVSGLSEGINEFVWTIRNGSGTCTPTTDTVAISYTQMTKANAGANQALCVGSAILAANSAGAGEVGQWSLLSGSGNIVDVNDPNTSVTDLVYGLNQFVWTITDAAKVCIPSADTVNIYVIGDQTVADAGNDQLVCSGNTTLSANNTKTGETGIWIVLNGPAVLADLSAPNTDVTGLTEGVNTFVWTISDNSGTCPATSDTVTVNYIQLTAAVAGPDQGICTDSTSLAANTVGAGEIGTWTLLTGSGSGTFADANDPTTSVTGLSFGVNEFIWTISDTANVCTPTSDTVKIEVIGNLTVADAGTDQSVCADNTALSANAVAASGETGIWTSLNPAAVLVDANDPNTAVSGLAVGINEFVWTISDNSGTCPATSDTVRVNYINLTEADAGSDQGICADSTMLAANTVGAGEIGTWTLLTGSGSGTFADAHDPTTSVTGLSFGVNEFIWTVSDTANICTPTSDTVRIEVIGNLTVADAGTDQSVCAANATLLANAVAATGETGVWTSLNPAAVIVDANDPNTAVSGLTVGINEFVWTISDNSGTCPATSDTVTVNHIQLTAAIAGPDQGICSDSTSLAANTVGVGEVGTWTLLTGSGTFADAHGPTTSVTGLSFGVNEFIWTVSDTANVCTPTSDTVRIEMIGNLTVADAGTDQSVCAANTTLSANAVVAGSEAGLWTSLNPAAVIADVNDPNTAVSGLTVGINEFVWTVSDNSGTCPATSDTVRVNYVNNLVASVTISTDAATTVCPSDLVTFEAHPTNGGTVPTYQWYVDGVEQVGATSAIFKTSFSGGPTFEVYAVMTAGGSGASCIIGSPASSNTITLSGVATTTVSIAADMTTICAGDAVTFEATPVNGGSTPTFQWFVNSGAVAGETNAIFTTTTLNNGDEVYVEVQAGGIGSSCIIGSATSNALSINVPSNLVASVSVSTTATTVCAGETVTFEATPQNGGTAPTYQWYVNATPVPGATSSLYTSTLNNGDEVFVEMTAGGTASSCVTGSPASSIPVAVTVRPAGDPACAGGGGNPTACGAFYWQFEDTPPTCGGDDGKVVFNNITYNGTTPPIMYSIRKVGEPAFDDQANNPEFIGLNAGDYEYKLTNLDNNDICTGTFVLRPETSVTASASDFEDVACYGAPIGGAEIAATGSSTGEYYYSIDGITWVLFTPGNKITDLPPDGTYNIMVGEEPHDNCPAYVEVTINNQYDPVKLEVANLEITPTSCNESNGSVTIYPDDIIGGVSPYFIALENDNIYQAVTSDGVVFENLPKGTLDIKIKDSSNPDLALTCEVVEEITITSPNGVASAVQDISAPDCSGGGKNGKIGISINESLTTADPPYQFGISRQDNQDNVIFHDLNWDDSKGKYYAEVDTLSSGTYYVFVISLASGDSCPDRKPVTISGGATAVTYDLEETPISCFGETGGVRLTNFTGAPGIDYAYQLFDGEGNLSQEGVITPDRAQALNGFSIDDLSRGKYKLKLSQVQPSVNCTVNATPLDFIIDGPKAEITLESATQVALPDQPTGSIVINMVKGGKGPYAVSIVEFAPVFLTQNIFPTESFDLKPSLDGIHYETEIYDLYAGVYTMIITDSFGCTVEFKDSIDYDRSIFIPNIFTPNGDELNPSFQIRNLPEESTMVIMNRWGKIVYQNDDYDNSWDGGDLPDGVYYYKLSTKDETFSGWVEIWRGSTP